MYLVINIPKTKNVDFVGTLSIEIYLVSFSGHKPTKRRGLDVFTSVGPENLL